MSTTCARRRSALLGAALGALLSPVLLLATASPAAADAAGATITQPSGSGAVRDRGDVTVAGSVDSTNGGELSIASSGTEHTSDTRTNAGGLSCSIDAVQGGCGWSGPLPNGSYTVKLVSRAYSASSKCGPANTQTCTTKYDANTVTRTLVLQVPPAAPTSVVASNSGRVVTVSWSKGAEPDLTHYAVYGNSAELVQVSATNGDACSSSRCSITIDYTDAPDVTGTQAYSVKAYRSDGASDEVGSAMSGSSSVTLPDPPKPSAGGDGGGSGGTTGGTTGGGSTGGSGGGSTGGSGGGSTGGSGGGSTGGGSDSGSGGTVSGGGGTIEEQPTANDGRGGISFSGRPGLGLKFTTSGGGIQLPSLPGSGNPQPHVATPEGTYDPSLPYGDQTAIERSVERGLGTRLVTSIGDFTTDVDQLVRALAGALILLLVGAHVRQVSRTSRYE